MKKTEIKRILSLFICTVLIAAMALAAFGCGEQNTGNVPAENAGTENVTGETPNAQEGTSGSEADLPDNAPPDAAFTSIGEGSRSFALTVTDKDGNERKFVVNTDEETVGEALINVGLLEGEPGPYGLYVKKVDGISADYDKDGVYWAFYVNGEYAMSGVDAAEIEDGAEYAFKVE